MQQKKSQIKWNIMEGADVGDCGGLMSKCKVVKTHVVIYIV